MEEKYLKIFGVIFICLLVICIVTKPRNKSVNIDELVQNIVIGVSKEDIKKIEVYKQTSEENPARMVFVKDNDQWHIRSYYNCKARNSTMEDLIDDVLEMTGKVRSSDPKHFDQYKISDVDGIHLLLKDEADKTLVNLIIGKRAEEYNSGFVRFADKDKVYFTDKNLLSSLKIYGDIDTLTVFKQKSFADLNAVDEDKDKLENIALIAGSKKLILKKIEKQIKVASSDSTKKDSTETKKVKEWVLLKGKNREIQLDQKEVEKFLQDVTNIYAQEVVDRIGQSLSDIGKEKRYGFDRPTHYIVLKEPDKRQKNIIFGKQYEKDKGYYLFVQYDRLVYKVSKYNYDKIFKWIDELPKKKKKAKTK